MLGVCLVWVGAAHDGRYGLLAVPVPEAKGLPPHVEVHAGGIFG